MKSEKDSMTETFMGEIDFKNFSLEKKEIRVNGKKIPLAIGEKIQYTKEDIPKTITAITVFEDNRVIYTLEWFNPDTNTFENETITLTELKLLYKKSLAKIKIGF